MKNILIHSKRTLLILLFLLCGKIGLGQCLNTAVTFTYTEGLMGCPCQSPWFTGTSSLNADSVRYKFGDGSDTVIVGPIDTSYVFHPYTTPGNYTAVFIIYGPGGGCIDSLTMPQNITCFSGNPGDCPIIGFFSHTNVGPPFWNGPCNAFEFNVGICADNTLLPWINSIYDTLPMVWDFGDGVIQVDTVYEQFQLTNHQYGAPGIYTTCVTIYGPDTCAVTRCHTVEINCGPPPCSDCISSFAPIPGKKYLISAWVKEDTAAQYKTNYNYPSITITYPSLAQTVGPFNASGQIIDGWQRLEATFTIPPSATDMGIKLDCAAGDCLFDDIRLHPYDASMKSYVYDPVTMKLSAELDERNYATIYEYDEEGKLIRVKKETEKGIMTIKESRNNTKKN